MKHLHVFFMLFLAFLTLSCSKDDDNGSSEDQAQDPGFHASLSGGTFSNYSFTLGVYQIIKGTGGNTLSIDVADIQGNAITLFLNGTGGFENGVVKQVGNIDSNNYTTHSVIRDQQTPVSYFSSTGSIKITNNREHPTESGHRLISGEFNITGSSIDGNHTTFMTGTFIELDYTD